MPARRPLDRPADLVVISGGYLEWSTLSRVVCHENGTTLS